MQSTVERTDRETLLQLWTEEGQQENPAEEMMLTHNRMPGLLVCSVRQQDEKKLYRYDITGMRGIEDLFYERKMRETEVRGLILSLSEALQSAEDYMLQEDHLLCHPKYVYGAKDGSFAVACYPAHTGSLQEGLKALAEYVLKTTDHSDDTAVDLAYDFYGLVMEGEYRFRGLLEKYESPQEVRLTPRPAESGAATGQDGTRYVFKEREENHTVLICITVLTALFCLVLILLIFKFR